MRNKANTPPLKSRLTEIFTIDPEAGTFHWSQPTNPRVKAGQIAGYLQKNGYWYIMVDSQYHLAHRLMWVYCNGDDSLSADEVIHHIDGDTTNNAIGNLRKDSKRHNSQLNRKKFPFIFTYVGKKQTTFNAQMLNKVTGKTLYKGKFTTIRDAYMWVRVTHYELYQCYHVDDEAICAELDIPL